MMQSSNDILQINLMKGGERAQTITVLLIKITQSTIPLELGNFYN